MHQLPGRQPTDRQSTIRHSFDRNIAAGLLTLVFAMFKVSVLVLFLLPAMTAPVFAQSPLQTEDPSSVRADDITDAQLRTLVRRAESEGMTVNEALQMAVQRGLPASEAAAIRRRVQQLESRPDEPDPYTDRQRVPPETEEVDWDEEDDWLFGRMEEEEHLIFGSRLFQERRLTFAPSAHLPTPRNYELGSGDELIIDIWGAANNLHRLEVSPEGTVTIDQIGPVYINGLTIEEAEKRLLQRLRSIYSGLNPGSEEANTWAQVSLGNVRSIQVSIIGEVRRPGTYTVSSLSSIFNALYRAGGPDSIGTYRDIRLIRDREVKTRLDIYDFLLDGNQEDNIRLRDGDVINVGPYDLQVELYGEVKRHGIYEMKENETVQNLINFAGGFSSQAYTDRVTIYRNTPSMRRVMNVRNDKMDEITLVNGDSVHVQQMIDRFENRVVLEGAVWREGDYEHTPGLSLYQLIQEADGIRPDAYRSRGIISRLKDDHSFEMVSFDVDQVLSDPVKYDVPLFPEDHVKIQSKFDMRDRQTVRISGAVRRSGTFDYQDKMTLEDLILEANGFRESASEGRIEVARRLQGEHIAERRGTSLAETFLFAVSRDLRLQEEDKSFKLQPFDIVYVRDKPDFEVQRNVKITGEVLYPGTYTLRERNERISDLIERAGGLTSEAYPPGASMTRLDTEVDRYRVDLDFAAMDEELEENDLEDEEEYGMEEQTSEERARELGLDDVLFDVSDFTDIEVSRIGIDMVSIVDNPGTRDDLYLQEGDVLNIPRELQTVRVSGAVMQEVELRHISGDNLSRYINRAGGFTQNAMEDRAYVIYANGDVERQRNYLFGIFRSMPDIEPGAEIIIPTRAERQRMETGEVIAISSAVVSMAATLAIAIDRVSR